MSSSAWRPPDFLHEVGNVPSFSGGMEPKQDWGNFGTLRVLKMDSSGLPPAHAVQ
ncbi:MAG: hypothetical protein J6J31_15340 [Thermoguttaceae bacterium]|nr:hypothetical protein [Thermoguttaceae bacterium]